MTEFEPAVPKTLAGVSDPGSAAIVGGRLWVSQFDTGCIAFVDGLSEDRLRSDIRLDGGALYMAQVGAMVVIAGEADGKLTVLDANRPKPGATFTKIVGNPTDLAAAGQRVLVIEKDRVQVYGMKQLEAADVFGTWPQQPCAS